MIPVVASLLAFDKTSMCCNRLVNSLFLQLLWLTKKKKKEKSFDCNQTTYLHYLLTLNLKDLN